MLAKLLYRQGSVLAYECDRLTADMLIGTKETPGELLEAVRRQPFQLILLERIDAASPEVIHLLHGIVTHGSCSARNGGKPISFEHATLIMTTSKDVSTLAALAEKNLPSAVWQREAADVLAAETLFDPVFFSAIADIAFCQRPSDHVQSEVAALLLRKETAAHGLTLAYTDPEILVTLISQITDETGFALLPEQVKRLLRKPLIAAAQPHPKKLSLRVRRPETTFREEPAMVGVDAGWEELEGEMAFDKDRREKASGAATT